MPKFSQMVERKYLHKDDLDGHPDGMVVTIATYKRMNVAMEDQPEEFKWAVKFQELEKPMILNSTNLQLLERATGHDDAKATVGLQVWIYIDENIQYQGRLVGGLRIKRAPAPTPVTAPAPDLDDMAPPESERADPRIERARAGRNLPAAPAPAARAGGQTPPKRFEDLEDDIPF